MKSLKLKNRSNQWITHDIIKLMYQRDSVHAKAIQKNDPLLWQNYRQLRNKVTCVIKERKNAYFSDINVLCRNDPKIMWSEIKRLVPNISELSHITNDISANDFNQHFANIGNKMIAKFQIYQTSYYGKVQKVFTLSVSPRYLTTMLKNISVLSLIGQTMIFWVWMLYYWGNRPHIFLNH